MIRSELFRFLPGGVAGNRWGFLLLGLLVPASLHAQSPKSTSPGSGAHGPGINLPALRRAVEDLIQTFEGRYPEGGRYLARLGEMEKAATRGDIREQFLSGLESARLPQEGTLASFGRR